METLFKPTPIVFNTLSLIQNYNNFIACAGSDIEFDAKVYLLYEIPTSLLARRFSNYDGCNSGTSSSGPMAIDIKNDCKFKIMVGFIS